MPDSISATDPEIFTAVKDTWPDACAIIRTRLDSQEFQVTNTERSPGDKFYKTERIERKTAIEINGLAVGYSAGAQTIVVFEPREAL